MYGLRSGNVEALRRDEVEDEGLTDDVWVAATMSSLFFTSRNEISKASPNWGWNWRDTTNGGLSLSAEQDVNSTQSDSL